MNAFSFLGITVVEILNIVFLIVTLILLFKNRIKISVWIVSFLLLLNLLGNWNTWFTMYIIIKNNLMGQF